MTLGAGERRKYTRVRFNYSYSPTLELFSVAKECARVIVRSTTEFPYAFPHSPIRARSEKSRRRTYGSATRVFGERRDAILVATRG